MSDFLRRKFIKNSGLAVSGIFFCKSDLIRQISPVFTERPELNGLPLGKPGNELQEIAEELIRVWGKTLLDLQIIKPGTPEDGLIIYPPENKVHGRIGDSFYPFLHIAAKTGDSLYIEAAIRVYHWMERTVSEDDGSWLNEPRKGSWKGTTVFTSIALAQALKNHGALLQDDFRIQIMERLGKSGDFIYRNFTVDYGNINYPVAGTYCLALLAELLDRPEFLERARKLAEELLPFFSSPDHFLTGEGGPYYTPSPKNCYSVDLGYNIEESLPALVLYNKLHPDPVLFQKLLDSMRTHMKFMLPDGGWDNSWGTRNYKWTYWGSRTSDGCQPAYGLMADADPAFYRVALLNTKLLREHTHEGILYGGPHYRTHGIVPSLHHSFCHLQALVTMLDQGIPEYQHSLSAKIPREIADGIDFFPEIQSWLISRAGWRATVTGYDRNYKDYQGGHASGGALSILWHQRVGLITAASMNEYQLFEKDNMQSDPEVQVLNLTPRLEYELNGIIYSSCNDLAAIVKVTGTGSELSLMATGRLTDIRQIEPPVPVRFQMSYRFSESDCSISFSHDGGPEVRMIVPLVSAATEPYTQTRKKLVLHKKNCRLQVQSTAPMEVLATQKHKRVFNYVPGLQAIPVCVRAKTAILRFRITDK